MEELKDRRLTYPAMLRSWIASLQGTTTHTQADRIVTARYSAFLFITQFIIFSLLGVLVQISEFDGREESPRVRKSGQADSPLPLSSLSSRRRYPRTRFGLEGALVSRHDPRPASIYIHGSVQLLAHDYASSWSIGMLRPRPAPFTVHHLDQDSPVWSDAARDPRSDQAALL